MPARSWPRQNQQSGLRIHPVNVGAGIPSKLSLFTAARATKGDLLMGSGSNSKHRGYYRAMHDPDQGELRRRLELLAPFLRALGPGLSKRTPAAGILTALPDSAFPVSDARFHRTAKGFTYHPHGPVYFTITRSGELGWRPWRRNPSHRRDYRVRAAGAGTGSGGCRAEEGATEWFPPPRFVLDTDTSRLYIAAVSRTHQPRSRQSFMPVEQYIEERAAVRRSLSGRALNYQRRRRASTHLQGTGREFLPLAVEAGLGSKAMDCSRACSRP